MTTRKFALLSVLVVVLGSCGGRPGTDRAYQGDTNNCSVVFVNEYNLIVQSINSGSKRSDLESVKVLAQEFKTKYKDVICVAEVRGPQTTTRQVAVEKDLDELISQINTLLINRR